MERNKDSQSFALSELKNELKSVKSLLLSRRAKLDGGSDSLLNLKPTIPPWQLNHLPIDASVVKAEESFEENQVVDAKAEDAEEESTSVKGSQEVSGNTKTTAVNATESLVQQFEE